jgi:hypothetical protein
MLLTIGAMILLSTIMLRVNTSNFNSDNIRAEAQFGMIATSIGTSIIEEAKGLSFDASTDTGTVNNLNELTDAALLGRESGETYSTFNDFDDFDDFTKVDSSMPSAVFNISCKVDYVDPSNVNVPSIVNTWHKKITVRISSPAMRDTIQESSIYSYWYFR